MATAFTATTAPVSVVNAARAGVVLAAKASFALSAALAINDTIAMVTIPAGHRIVDAVLVADDLDTNVAPEITLDVGIAGGDTDALFAASTVAQAGGLVRPTVKTAARDVATAADRVVQVLIKAAPATGATTGSIDLVVFYQAD